MKNTLSGLLICLAIFAVSTVANGNLLVNGDFDTPIDGLSGTSWDVYSSIEGWTAGTGTAGIEIQRNTVVTAHTSPQYVELDSHNLSNSNSAMYQEIKLEAGTYNLDWMYHARTNNNDDDNGIEFFVTADTWDSGAPYLKPDSTDYFYYNSISKKDNTQISVWEQVSWSFTLTENANYRLWFGAYGNDNTLGGFVDSVSLNPVPEPTTMLLFGTGLIGLAGVVRRKKK